MALTTETDDTTATGVTVEQEGSYKKGSSNISSDGPISSSNSSFALYRATRGTDLSGSARVDGVVRMLLENNVGTVVVDKKLLPNEAFDAGGSGFNARLFVTPNATTDGLTVIVDTVSAWTAQYKGAPADFEESQGTQKPKLTIIRSGASQHLIEERMNVLHSEGSEPTDKQNRGDCNPVGRDETAGGKVTIAMELEITA